MSNDSSFSVDECIARGIELSLDRRHLDGNVVFNHALAISADREKTLEAIIQALQSNGFKFEAQRYAHHLRTLNHDNELACSLLGFETSAAKHKRLQVILDAAIRNVQERNAETLLAVADAAEAMGAFELAYSYILSALECQRPTDATTVLSLSGSCVRLGRHEESKKWLSVARFHGAEERDLLCVEAQGLVAVGNFGAARLVLQDLQGYAGHQIQSVPYAHALLQTVLPVRDEIVLAGEAFEQNGDFNSAIDHFKIAMTVAKKDKFFESLLYELKLALVLIRFGEQGGTRNDLEELFTLNYSVKPEPGLTPISAGTWFIFGVLDASSAQDGSDFAAYLTASDYQTLYRYNCLDCGEMLVGLMGREPENIEARVVWERYRERFV